MSLNYEIKLGTELEPTQIMNILAKCNDLQWVEKSLNGLGILVNSYEEPDKLYYKDIFGFAPTVIVDFKIKPNINYEKSIRIMIRVIMHLIKEITGNAILLFNYETIMFHKIGNQLIFNQEMCNPYIESELKNLDVQYEIKDLESPLL